MAISQTRFFEEIAEQPAVLARILKRFTKIADNAALFLHKDTRQLILIGEGSSLNVLNMVQPWLEVSLGKPVRVFSSVECQTFLTMLATQTGNEQAKLLRKQTSWVFLSQSGNTASLVTLLKNIQTFLKVKPKQLHSVLLTNGSGSQLEALSQKVFYLEAGVEESIPATKTVSASLLTLLLLASGGNQVKPEFKKIPKMLSHWLESAEVAHQVRQLARRAMGYRQILLIGEGLMAKVLPEIALKLTEIVGMPVHTSEMERFQHGYKMLLKNSMPAELLVIYVVSPKINGTEYYSLLERHWVDASGKVWNPQGQIHLVCPQNAPKMPSSLAKRLGVHARCITQLPDVPLGYPGLFAVLLFFQWMASVWTKEAHLNPNASPLSKFVGK